MKQFYNKNGFGKAYKGNLLLLVLLLGITNFLVGQTMPAAQDISSGYTQDFTSLANAYPSGFQGWTLGSFAPSTGPRTVSPSSNINTITTGTTASSSAGIYNYNGKIGIYAGNSNDINLALAINTTSATSPKRIKVKFDAMVMRNLYNGTDKNLQCALVLQYRTGTTGDFKLLGPTVRNSETPQGSGTIGTDLKNFTFILPEECNNQPVVQLRWIVRHISGLATTPSTDRPSFALDNIEISTISPNSTPFIGYVISKKNITDVSRDTYETNTLSGVTRTEILSEYGGSLADLKSNPAGYFRTYKDPSTGVWNFLDPLGHIFYSIGVNDVEKGGGADPVYLLKSINANTIGNFSDETINTMPYTPRLNLGLNYKNTTPRTSALYANQILPVFDNDFETFCFSKAAEIPASYKTDKNIIGYFSDNEMPLANPFSGESLIQRWLNVAHYGGQAAADADPNYIAAVNWMKGRHGGMLTTPNSADKQEWPGVVAGRYYQVCNNAIKASDGNHLYLGSRLHQDLLNPFLFKAAGMHCDVVSVNNYNVWEDAEIKERLDVWAANSNKPILIGEFYAQAQDAGLPNASGAGFKVYTQQDRADFFESYTMSVLKHKSTVGFQYFEYQDEPTSATDPSIGNNKGLLNTYYEWWEPMRLSFTKIGQDVYRLREYLFTLDAALPVNFKSFSAKADGERVRLNWTTTSEKNNSYFEVHHSIDGKIFSPISRINGKGTISLSSNYTTYHNAPEVGINYYKLWQFDINGKVTELETQALSFGIDKTLSSDVYPNPSSGQLTVNLKSFQGASANLSIIDMTGKVVLMESVSTQNSEIRLNLQSRLSTGRYILRVSDKDMNLLTYQNILFVN